MVPTRDINDLILCIYDTVTSPNSWDATLHRIADGMGARESNIFQGDAAQQELQSAWLSHGLNGIFDTPSYKLALEEEEKIYHAIQHIVTESRLVASRDIQAEYHRRGFPSVDMSLIENILERDYGIRSRYTAPLNRQAHHYEFFTVHFPMTYDDPRFPSEGVALGNFLIPHLCKALSINRPFVLLQRRYNAVLKVLDRFKLGVVILGTDLSVWLQNESARRIFDKRDAITLKRDGRIAALSREQQQQLSVAVAKLTREEAFGETRSTRMRLGDPSLREPYIADLSILSAEEFGGAPWQCGILMVIVDPLRTDIINSDCVADLFALTRAESEVFSLVVQGLTNREVADARGVNPETVSSQLKSVLSKTGCRRRGDLVHLAHSVNIPVDHPSTCHED